MTPLCGILIYQAIYLFPVSKSRNCANEAYFAPGFQVQRITRYPLLIKQVRPRNLQKVMILSDPNSRFYITPKVLTNGTTLKEQSKFRKDCWIRSMRPSGTRRVVKS